MAEVGAGLEEPTHREFRKCHDVSFLRLNRRGPFGHPLARAPPEARLAAGARDPRVEWPGFIEAMARQRKPGSPNRSTNSTYFYKAWLIGTPLFNDWLGLHHLTPNIPQV